MTLMICDGFTEGICDGGDGLDPCGGSEPHEKDYKGTCMKNSYCGSTKKTVSCIPVEPAQQIEARDDEPRPANNDEILNALAKVK